MQTPRDHLGTIHVRPTCTKCGHTKTLDLAALITRGYGDTPLDKLPLRCNRWLADDDGPGVHRCRGRRVRWSLAAVKTGP